MIPAFRIKLSKILLFINDKKTFRKYENAENIDAFFTQVFSSLIIWKKGYLRQDVSFFSANV